MAATGTTEIAYPSLDERRAEGRKAREKDYGQFVKAVRSGRLAAIEGV